MNLTKIKDILDSSLTDTQIESAILSIIAEDENAILYVMEILHNERVQNKELILDSNLELSRALVVLNDGNLKSNKRVIVDPKWVASKIKEHYLKWQNRVVCNFNIEGLP